MLKDGIFIAAITIPVCLGTARADWSAMEAAGEIAADAEEFDVAGPSAHDALVAFVRKDRAGNRRIYAAVHERKGGRPLNNGAPVDGSGDGEECSSPLLVRDSAGGTALFFLRKTGGLWKPHSRLFDGSAFSDIGEDGLVDTGRHAGVGRIAAAFTGPGHMLAVFTKLDGPRMALFAAEYASGKWLALNGGNSIDSPGGGCSDFPGIATDERGRAVVTYVQDGRLFSLEYNGVTLRKLYWAKPMERSDLGKVRNPRPVTLKDGRVMVIYDQETPSPTGLINRLYAGILFGKGDWIRFRDGEALDPLAMDCRMLDAAPFGSDVLVAYSIADKLPGIYNLSINPSGGGVLPLNEGTSLAPPGPAAFQGRLDTDGGTEAVLVMRNGSRVAGFEANVRRWTTILSSSLPVHKAGFEPVTEAALPAARMRN